jgi:hypothetical protein
LPYETVTFGSELAFVVLFVLVDLPRLKLGSSGNRAEKLHHLIAMLGLSAILIMYHTYYVRYQVYVCVPLFADAESQTQCYPCPFRSTARFFPSLS